MSIKCLAETAYFVFFDQYRKLPYAYGFFTSSINSKIKVDYRTDLKNICFEITAHAVCTKEAYEKLQETFRSLVRNTLSDKSNLRAKT